MGIRLKVMLCSLAAVLVTATAAYAEDTIVKPGTEPTMYGIDVSKYQGNISWTTVFENVDFAILRCGYGQDEPGQDDAKWKRNADACTKLGIPFGVYIYSYADSVEKAKGEADHVLRLVKGYDLAFPIYYDIEDNVHVELEPEELGDIAKAFCNKIEKAGYEVGVYSNKYIWESKLTDPVFDTKSWYKWIAQTGVKFTTYKKAFSMWQCSFEGKVDGIEGDVDIDYWYGELRGIEKSKVKEKMKVTPAPSVKPEATAKPTASPEPTPAPAPTPRPVSILSSYEVSDTFIMVNYGDYVELKNNSDNTYRIRAVIISYDKGELINSKSHDLTFNGKKSQRFKMYRGSDHRIFIYTPDGKLVQVPKKK